MEMTGNLTIIFLGIGLVAGTFSATFGVGSGIILIPALAYFASFPQKEAQGISLAVMVPMALMGAIRYHLNPDIPMDYRVILVLGAAVIVGANLGASFAGALPTRVLQFCFALILFVVGVRMMLLATR